MIGGVAAGVPEKAHDGADVDDRSAAGLGHLLGGELGTEEPAGLVHRDDAMPALYLAERYRSRSTIAASSISGFCRCYWRSPCCVRY
jgi:hypothetical protein